MGMGSRAGAALAFCLAVFAQPGMAAAPLALVQVQPDQQMIAQGDALASAGRFAEAEAVFRRAAQSAEAAYGPNDARTLLGWSRVGLALKEMGRYEDAEPILRQTVSRDEAATGPESAQVALDLFNLANNLGAQHRFAEAEAALTRAAANDAKALGPEHPSTVRDLANLAMVLDLDGRSLEAEPIHRRVLAIADKAKGGAPYDPLINLGRTLVVLRRGAEAEPFLRRALARAEASGDRAQTDTALNLLGQAVLDRGRPKDAAEVFRRRLALIQSQPAADPARLPAAQYNLSLALLAAGQFAEAESLQRQATAGFEKSVGADAPEVAVTLRGLTASLQSNGRYADAERLLRRAVAIDTRALGPDHLQTMADQQALAGALFAQNQTAAAEQIQRQVLAARQAKLAADDPDMASILDDLAESLAARGAYAEAEPLQRRALDIAERGGGKRDRQTARYAAGLAAILQAQDRPRDAEPLLRRALGINERMLGKNHLTTSVSRENLSYALYRSGRYDAAAQGFRGGCGREIKTASKAVRQSPLGRIGNRAGMGAAACSLFHAETLWGWAKAGGGPDLLDQPDALKAEAFIAVQRASASTPGQVLSIAAARRFAESAGAGEDVRAYEQLLSARAQLDDLYLELSADPDAAAQRQDLVDLRGRMDAIIPQLETKLAETQPRYWAMRSPQPVTLGALQARVGRDAALLRADEALIVFAVPERGARGLVFAVTKDKTAWAELPYTGAELRTRVDAIRSQIAEGAYRIRAVRDGEPPEPAAKPPSFDRQGAYELYQGLLGAPAIQAVLADKPIWMFVTSGAMNSLPPTILVTAPPAGGAAGDADPAALRATAWLVRSKAVAVLPDVASLRIFRQNRTAAIVPSEPLLAFADPDFAGRFRRVTNPDADVSGLLAADAYFSEGGARAEQLASLPPLAGTRREGLALLAALGGAQDGLLVGPDATETALKQRDADGRLAKAAVIEFATHGLVWGDFDVAEPSLALAAPAPGSDPVTDDGLLTASEASELRLNAQWVILSACNTAGPAGVIGDGLSGLTSAFLHAGAERVLATHWPVRDDVPPRLIPAMLILEKQNPGMARAEALRRATVEVLDDPRMGAYYPGAWAPFVLVGEAR